MMRAIVYWALAGFVVAWGWVMFGARPGFHTNFGEWTIVAVTAPASILGHRMPETWYQFILLNAAVYAVVGLGFGAVLKIYRYRFSHSKEGRIGY
jgi:hypothetical protein